VHYKIYRFGTVHWLESKEVRLHANP
jgi:hypothetical protein